MKKQKKLEIGTESENKPPLTFPHLENLEDYTEAEQAHNDFIISDEKGVSLTEVFRGVK
jgi:hypothetical protein